MYHQFNIQHFYVLPTQCIDVFCVDLRTDNDFNIACSMRCVEINLLSLPYMHWNMSTKSPPTCFGPPRVPSSGTLHSKSSATVTTMKAP